MSLRLAVKRSLDDAERDEHEIRDIYTQLELLRDLELAELKEHVHPVRSASSPPRPPISARPAPAHPLPSPRPLACRKF